MKQNKEQQIDEWLEANPGKEREDWLLEVRCKDEKQRRQVSEILRLCNENNLVYRIPFSFPGEPEVWFDFAVHGYPIDLDAPDELFEDINPKRRWEAAERYLSWKAVHDLGEGHESELGYISHEDYFHDNFMDWRDHCFLEGFAPEKNLTGRNNGIQRFRKIVLNIAESSGFKPIKLLYYRYFGYFRKKYVETETACNRGADGGLSAVAVGCTGCDDCHCADLDALPVD